MDTAAEARIRAEERMRHHDLEEALRAARDRLNAVGRYADGLVSSPDVDLMAAGNEIKRLLRGKA